MLLNNDIAFLFCGNAPSNSLDSIGYVHNLLVNKVMSSGRGGYVNGNEIDYDKLLSDCLVALKELGYSHGKVNIPELKGSFLFVMKYLLF